MLSVQPRVESQNVTAERDSRVMVGLVHRMVSGVEVHFDEAKFCSSFVVICYLKVLMTYSSVCYMCDALDSQSCQGILQFDVSSVLSLFAVKYGCSSLELARVQPTEQRSCLKS